MSVVSFTIFGEPASKANSRKLATVGPAENRRTLFIKSEKARDYEADALRQIPPKARVRLEGPVRVTMTIFYTSERPDLDESIVLDVMQDRWKRDKTTGVRHLLQAGVYRNDRQVRSKVVNFALDPANPRAEITVEPLQAQQAALLPPELPAPPSKKPRRAARSEEMESPF